MSISKKPLCPFFDNRSISESSKKLYISKLKKLNDGKIPTSLDFLKNTDVIMKQLNAMVSNTRRSGLIAIVSACKSVNPELHAFYTKFMDASNKELKENKGIMSEKQKQNWLPLDEIMGIAKTKSTILKVAKKSEITESDYDELLNYTVLCLYTMIPPRRSLDYVSMTMSPSEKGNYMEKKDFVFQNYKTAKTYDTQRVMIPANLMKVLKVYLKFKPKSDFFLVRKDSLPLNNKTLSHILHNVIGKNISTQMLRNIYATSVAKPLLDKLESVSTQMGTSVQQLDSTYSKNT